jgi:hypothetical protein
VLALVTLFIATSDPFFFLPLLPRAICLNNLLRKEGEREREIIHTYIHTYTYVYINYVYNNILLLLIYIFTFLPFHPLSHWQAHHNMDAIIDSPWELIIHH